MAGSVTNGRIARRRMASHREKNAVRNLNNSVSDDEQKKSEPMHGYARYDFYYMK